jgi:hypothetical protein
VVGIVYVRVGRLRCWVSRLARPSTTG